jgi:hypothetical protein
MSFLGKSGRLFYDDTPYTVAASASGIMRAVPSMISAASDGAEPKQLWLWIPGSGLRPAPE